MASGAILILTCIGLMGLVRIFANNCKTSNNSTYHHVDEVPPKYEEVDRPPSYSV